MTTFVALLSFAWRTVMSAVVHRWWARVWPTALTTALIACIPFGLFMAWVMDDPDWLWFCVPIFLFLS